MRHTNPLTTLLTLVLTVVALVACAPATQASVDEPPAATEAAEPAETTETAGALPAAITVTIQNHDGRPYDVYGYIQNVSRTDRNASIVGAGQVDENGELTLILATPDPRTLPPPAPPTPEHLSDPNAAFQSMTLRAVGGDDLRIEIATDLETAGRNDDRAGDRRGTLVYVDRDVTIDAERVGPPDRLVTWRVTLHRGWNFLIKEVATADENGHERVYRVAHPNDLDWYLVPAQEN